jgi:hypothetical protein
VARKAADFATEKIKTQRVLSVELFSEETVRHLSANPLL